eukprot:SM000328S12467  [mRNA]  locus=s328:80075:81541:- [translate_table: standard]
MAIVAVVGNLLVSGRSCRRPFAASLRWASADWSISRPPAPCAAAELKKSLYAVFSQFGKILDIVALKTLKLRGQAWVVFDDITSATNALRQMQGFPFYDKPMRISYAKAKSDVISKADGTFVPRDKKKKAEEKARKKLEDSQQAQYQPGVIPADGGGYGYGMPQPGMPMGGMPPRPTMPEAPAPPNSLLFLQALPHETTSAMLQTLFAQFPGFKEVRMVEAKPGIAFVEFGDDMQATVALQGLQGYRISPTHPMQISYAKK